MIEKQQYFKLAALQPTKNSDRLTGVHSQYDQYSYKQQFQEGTAAKGMARSTQISVQSQGSNTHHSVFDYLGLSLSLPLYYHPHHILSQKFTKTAKDLLPHRE